MLSARILNVGDIRAAQGWEDLESYYGINLDPARMRGEPAVLSGRFGQGRVLLSLLHFDMPGDRNGLTVLRNLWKLWEEEDSPEGRECGKAFTETPLPSLVTVRPSPQSLIRDIQEAVDGLIDLGIRNFLWFWRNSFMLQWKRGVRGLEYCTLKVLADEIAKAITSGSRQTVKTDSMSPGDAERVDGLVEERLTESGRNCFPLSGTPDCFSCSSVKLCCGKGSPSTRAASLASLHCGKASFLHPRATGAGSKS